MIEGHRLYELLTSGLPGAGIEASATLGAFVKNVSTSGLVTVQLADGTEATVQLQTGGVVTDLNPRAARDRTVEVQ